MACLGGSFRGPLRERRARYRLWPERLVGPINAELSETEMVVPVTYCTDGATLCVVEVPCSRYIGSTDLFAALLEKLGKHRFPSLTRKTGYDRTLR